MKHRIEYVGCLLAIVGATACGGGGGKKGEVNEQAARSAAQQTIAAATTAVDSDDGQAAAFQFLGAAQAGQNVVTPAGGTAQGTCECDQAAQSCNFTDCAQGPNSLSGTISWGGGNVKCDLTFTVTSPIAPLSLTTMCDLTVTDTSMSGTLSSTGMLTVPDGAGAQGVGDVSWSIDTVYNDVTISGGQATGGSVSVDAEYEAGGEKFSGSGTVNFP